jgi:hypothetical protein
MASIYRVDYSDSHGFFVNVVNEAVKVNSGTWAVDGPEEQRFTIDEGWVSSEVEAVQNWRNEAIEAAKNARIWANTTELIADGPAPVTVPKTSIMKPEFK